MPSKRRQNRPPWFELSKLCVRLHRLMYRRRDRKSALARLDTLEALVDSLPSRSGAIVHSEALALLHELKGDYRMAIRSRKNEIRLIRKLHKSFEGNPDKKLRAWALQRRDIGDLAERREIVRKLAKRYDGIL